jgi:hypothetical protein
MHILPAGLSPDSQIPTQCTHLYISREQPCDLLRELLSERFDQVGGGPAAGVAVAALCIAPEVWMINIMRTRWIG